MSRTTPVGTWPLAITHSACLGMLNPDEAWQLVLTQFSHLQSKNVSLSEVGFEPTPTYVDQNLSLAP